MSEFKKNVIKAVNMVPYGTVASYGQIALMVGVPRAARQVGWILNGLEADLFESSPQLPWWRIVNNQGRISIKGTKYHDAIMQKARLEEEGIEVTEDFTFDIEKYRYRPDMETIKSLELEEEYVEKIIQKYLI